MPAVPSDSHLKRHSKVTDQKQPCDVSLKPPRRLLPCEIWPLSLRTLYGSGHEIRTGAGRSLRPAKSEATALILSTCTELVMNCRFYNVSRSEVSRVKSGLKSLT